MPKLKQAKLYHFHPKLKPPQKEWAGPKQSSILHYFSTNGNKQALIVNNDDISTCSNKKPPRYSPTLFLVDVKTDETPDIEHNNGTIARVGGMTITELTATHPGILEDLKAGDILENVNYDGYRSDNVYFFDGTNLVHANVEYDDYGSPPLAFGVFFDVPLGCYKGLTGPRIKAKKGMERVNKKYCPKKEQTFRWHFPETAYPLYPKDLNLRGNYLKNKFDEAEYLRATDLPNNWLKRVELEILGYTRVMCMELHSLEEFLNGKKPFLYVFEYQEIIEEYPSIETTNI
eukprot:Awhi_evm1s14449